MIFFTDEPINPVCLMAQVSTDSSIDTSIRDTDNDRTHHINRFECYDNLIRIPRDFFQPTSCVCLDDSDNQYETANATFIDDDGMDYSHRTESVVPVALVAQVSYVCGDDSAN